jgi:hypothetical protein
VTEPELCAKLLALIDNIIERMLDCGAVVPGPLPLIAGADAAIATELADRDRRLASEAHKARKSAPLGAFFQRS